MLTGTDDRLNEVLRKVRRLEILMRGKVRELISGEYQSRFKGQGLDFDEFREYHPGDEIRFIDWNVTARTGSPYIKKFTEQRELTVMLLVDISASVDFATTPTTKRDMIAEIAAAFAFSAAYNHDKTGLILFSDQLELYLPPRRGFAHALRMLREILYRQAEGRGTNYQIPLELVTARVHHRCLAVLASDFLSGDLEPAVGSTSVKHDVIACQVLDPAEFDLPKAGTITLRDPETGREILVPTSKPSFRDRYHQRFHARQLSLERTFRKAGTDHLPFRTDQNATDVLHAFLRNRPITTFYR